MTSSTADLISLAEPERTGPQLGRTVICRGGGHLYTADGTAWIPFGQRVRLFPEGMLMGATGIVPAAKTQRHKVTGDVHLVLRCGDNVLFGRRQNTGFGDGAWHLPSGHLEAEESVVAALIREAEEEVGVVIRAEDVRFSHVMHSSSSGGRVAFFFTVTDWEGEPVNREPEKCSALGWFALDALPDHMIDYCRNAMRYLADEVSFSVYGW
ncbi:NUDIX domain-containing protein [Nocardia sp. NBC_00565]|uniref:NUDIX hydrolase n=1 Tax=Nocardia sp. NBC_00565 TaxID=2975993 RepID=UPI002E818C05|nr:NUDIX domain-containing protein [Nocardia sp. NBC_00565]WUC00405.1 NUDIX domain-containing protein [Nocardia sp. NBC_00565]